MRAFCSARERVAAQVHRQHEVGLLDDLLAVQVEVGEVQQQRVLLGRGALEVPDLVLGEALGLRVDAELVVVGDEHRLGGVAPAGGLLVVDAELGGEPSGWRSAASAAARRFRCAIRFV